MGSGVVDVSLMQHVHVTLAADFEMGFEARLAKSAFISSRADTACVIVGRQGANSI